MDADGVDGWHPHSECFNEIKFNIFVGKETNQRRSDPGLRLGTFLQTLLPVGGNPPPGFHPQPPLLIVGMQFFQVGVDFIPVAQTIPDCGINVPRTEPEFLSNLFWGAGPVNESLNHGLECYLDPPMRAIPSSCTASGGGSGEMSNLIELPPSQ